MLLLELLQSSYMSSGDPMYVTKRTCEPLNLQTLQAVMQGAEQVLRQSGPSFEVRWLLGVPPLVMCAAAVRWRRRALCLCRRLACAPSSSAAAWQSLQLSLSLSLACCRMWMCIWPWHCS